MTLKVSARCCGYTVRRVSETVRDKAKVSFKH